MAALFADASADLFASADWFDLSLVHARPLGMAAGFAVVQRAGRAVLALPLWHGQGGARGLDSPFVSRFAPLASRDAEPDDYVALLGGLRRFPLIRLDALAEADAALLAEAARRAGRVPIGFAHFGNWHEELAGRDYAAWLADRPGALRATIRRRSRAAAADPALRIACLTQPAEMAGAIAAYQTVYARSWKPAEPCAGFIPALIERMAERGILRLGLLWEGERPIAAQIWIASGGVAHVLKLAHDEAAASRSPGTVLSAAMLQRLIDADGVTEIDFGRGDDAYKQGWAGTRRQRMGLVLADPRQPRAWPVLARHALGRLMRR